MQSIRTKGYTLEKSYGQIFDKPRLFGYISILMLDFHVPPVWNRVPYLWMEVDDGRYVTFGGDQRLVDLHEHLHITVHT